MPRLLLRALVTLALVLPGLQAWAGEFTVSAAASLTDAFTELATRYEADNPGDRVRLNFAASGVLLQQLDQGAPVDVFASADQQTMDSAEARGLLAADSRRDFTRNTLVLVAPADSDLAVAHLDSLTAPGVGRIAVGNPDFVPAGRYARAALEGAGVWAAVEGKLINTQNVRQALDYVARGEVDAGFVYATDAALMADSLRVLLEVPLAEPVSYPVAVMAAAEDSAAARRFVAFLLSPVGQAILARYGFSAP